MYNDIIIIYIRYIQLIWKLKFHAEMFWFLWMRSCFHEIISQESAILESDELPEKKTPSDYCDLIQSTSRKLSSKNFHEILSEEIPVSSNMMDPQKEKPI